MNVETSPTATPADDSTATKVARDKANADLLAACERGDTEGAVRLVTCCGADVRAATGVLLLTPLHMAAMKGHEETISTLVTNFGAPVDGTTYTGMTALHYAAAFAPSFSGGGSGGAARLLVEKLGATVDVRDNCGWTPLIMAAWRGQYETVLLLAQLGADVGDHNDSTKPTALHFAAGSGRVDVMRTLVRDFGANGDAIDADGRTPLHFAAESGESEAAVALVREFGANVEAKAPDGSTPLHMAVLTNRSETVRTLIDTLGASLLTQNSDGLAPLHVAADNCDVDAVLLLLTRGADPSAPAASGWTPLHFAARHGSAEVVEALLDHGADPEATDGYEDEPHTAAFFAAMSGDEGACKVLAEAVG